MFYQLRSLTCLLILSVGLVPFTSVPSLAQTFDRSDEPQIHYSSATPGINRSLTTVIKSRGIPGRRIGGGTR